MQQSRTSAIALNKGLSRASLAALASAISLSVCIVTDAMAAPPHRTTWAEANGVTLRYELSGAGPRTIVLLHEMSLSLESWDEIAPDLARTNRVLRYDLRGFGLSQRITGDITIKDEVEDLRALLDALDIKGRVTLAGGAAGGAIALAFAAAYPDRVDGVVAISPAAYLQARIVPGQSAAAPANTAPPAPGTVVADDPAYPLEFQQKNAARYKRYRAISNAAPDSGATLRALYSTAFSEVMPKIQCPVLVVANEPWLRPVASFKELAAAAPKGEAVVMHAPHFATIATPEQLLPVLHGFLKKTAPGRP